MRINSCDGEEKVWRKDLLFRYSIPCLSAEPLGHIQISFGENNNWPETTNTWPDILTWNTGRRELPGPGICILFWFWRKSSLLCCYCILCGHLVCLYCNIFLLHNNMLSYFVLLFVIIKYAGGCNAWRHVGYCKFNYWRLKKRDTWRNPSCDKKSFVRDKRDNQGGSLRQDGAGICYGWLLVFIVS